jgi:hypothetical protein
MRPFLAYIMPVGDHSPVDPGYFPPGVGPGRPGGPGSPGGPGGPGRPGGPVYPSHPIANPWPPYVDAGPPGPQPPSGSQPHPEHPIYFPPEGTEPPLGIWGPPDMPPGYWGGGMGPGVKPQPKPEHPIVLPPDLPPTLPPAQGGSGEPIPVDWKTGWTQETGWIVVGVPTEPHPTPSK